MKISFLFVTLSWMAFSVSADERVVRNRITRGVGGEQRSRKRRFFIFPDDPSSKERNKLARLNLDLFGGPTVSGTDSKQFVVYNYGKADLIYVSFDHDVL